MTSSLVMLIMEKFKHMKNNSEVTKNDEIIWE